MVGTLLLVTLFYYSDDYSDSDPTLQVDIRNYKCHIKSSSKSYPKEDPLQKCERNRSVEQIQNFSSLPDNIKDLLYYRHCRHFPMLLDVPKKCGGANGSSDVFLLLVIKSSAANYDRREVLRKTWAKERLSNGVWIRRIFISGTMGTGYEKKRLNQLLKLEQSKYNDIIQWDFKDSFYNLTLKQMLFLEWMERNCPHAHFLFNGDDDVFANTDNMVLYLQNFEHNRGGKHLFAGHLIYNVGPIRDPYSKYYIPVQLYESKLYPAYCGGGGFLLSGYTAMVIYTNSHSIPILPIDDVYMGMCLAKAGLRPEHHLGVRTAGLHVPGKNIDGFDPCFFKEMLLVHRMLSGDTYTMWHRIQDPDLRCGPPNSRL